MPSAADTMHPRYSDPDSSWIGIGQAKTKKAKLEYVIRMQPAGSVFDDNDLTVWLSAATGVHQQRNVVARTRLSLEDDGIIVRLPASGRRPHILKFCLRIEGQFPGQQALI